MSNYFFKYPKQPYCGSNIKIYSEIERDVYPYFINFICTFSMYASEKAENTFQNTNEKKGIKLFQEYLDRNFLSSRQVTKRVRNLLPSEGYSVDPYLGFSFAYEHTGIESIKEFQKIYNPVTANIAITVTREKQRNIFEPEDCIDFILDMFIRLDKMFFSIQQESDHQLIFVPRSLATLEKQKRAKTLETMTWEI